MNEEEIIEQLKEAISEWYLAQEDGNYSVEFEEHDVKAIEGLLSLYQQEKEKNKKLEEEYAKVIESETDIAVGSHKLINNLAQAIRFMSLNEKLTVEDIIEEFSKEHKVTEEFMERWEKSQYEESHLKDKVIDMMVKDMPSDVVVKICEKQMDLEMDCYADFYDEKPCSECIKEYYFNKVKGNEK